MEINGLKKRVVVLDSEKFSNGLNFILSNSAGFRFMARYDSIDDVIRNIHLDRPEIVILEVDHIREPLERINKLYSMWPHIRLIVLSENLRYETIINMFSLGVSGYLSKRPSVINKIISYLEELMDDGYCLSSDVSAKLIQHFHINTSSPLSHRETQVLRLISNGNTYMEISNILSISAMTSRTHIKNIYKKLNVGKKSEALKRAHAEKLI